MRRFVKFLGGEKGASSYHSIFADPAPESGSKTDIAKNTRQTLSRNKPQAPLHISKLNQPSVAELSSPTTSTFSAPKGRESVAELPASSNTQVSELDAWNPAINPGQAAWKEVESQTEQQPKEEPKAKENEETKEEEKTHTSFLSISIDEGTVDEKTIANHTPILTPKPKPEPKPNLDSDLLIFSDTTDAIPGFGRPFGVAPTSILREQKTKEPEPEPNPDLQQQPGSTATGPKSPEAFFQQVDEELEALYADYLKSSGKQRSSASKAPKTARESISRSNPEPEACIICLEPFSADGVKAPDTLSIACQHTPSVCYICLAKSIKHDLDTKFWNEIKCPECKTLFIHNDIERFADEETFTRYNKLSFRHALNADKNFIWCLDCDFGQLHEPGAAQPRVRCLSCSAESCFKHSIGWHDGFTCDEYDAVLWDPDSYKAIKEKNSGTSETNAQLMTEKDMRRAKKKEETRQQKLHEAQKKAARKKQEEEAARVRKEKKAKAEAAQVQQENIEEQETSQEDVKDDFKEKIEMLKKRMREVEMSVKKVEETTKRCPGCQWPIEKNDGCDHMTCIKCRAEFCWACLNDYDKIRRLGNSMHKRSCKFHSDNLA